MISEEPIFTHTGKWTSTMALYQAQNNLLYTWHILHSPIECNYCILYKPKHLYFTENSSASSTKTIQPTGKVIHSTLNYSELSYYHLDFIIMVVPKVDHQVYEMYTCYIWMISQILYHAFSKKSATVSLPCFHTEPPKVIITIQILMMIMMMMPNATLLSVSHRYKATDNYLH